jgi:hypothetical protein
VNPGYCRQVNWLCSCGDGLGAAPVQGVGLVLPMQQVGSLEVNFCRVLAMRDTDRPKHGIQIGFSPQLL